MGTVFSSVKLTNAIDESLIARGLLSPKLLREQEVNALVDTGAVHLVISEKIAADLGLRIIGQQVAEFADGRRQSVDVTEAIILEIEGRKTTEDALVVGNGVLIGQVILEKLDLLVDCRNQGLICNPDNPDYPVTTVL